MTRHELIRPAIMQQALAWQQYSQDLAFPIPGQIVLDFLKRPILTGQITQY